MPEENAKKIILVFTPFRYILRLQKILTYIKKEKQPLWQLLQIFTPNGYKIRWQSL